MRMISDMVRRCASVAVALAAVPLFSLAASQQPAPSTAELQQRLQAKFEELHKVGNFPGGTAGLVLADGTSFGIAVGVSDRTARTPMKPTDRLLLGSVGKTYAAAVAIQMIHEGRFSLDDTLDRFFAREAWFPRIANASKITVRHLMTHTSGLVRYEFNPKFTEDLSANPDKVWTGPDRLAYLFDANPPFAPGEGWEYSDTNYIVLGMIIEKISNDVPAEAGRNAVPAEAGNYTGGVYYEELRKRILGPHGLKDTVPADSRTVPGLVQGYAGEKNPFGGADEMIKDGRFAVNPQFEWTGGGLAVTALDLAKWGKLLYEGKAFDPSMLPVMLEGPQAKLGPESRYGLGVIIRPSPLGTTYGHSGFMPGYMTELVYFPDLKVSVAVQVNTSAPRATGRPLRTFTIEFARIIAQ
jgi:D-alanyl-D-alanine carboxypeptidase